MTYHLLPAHSLMPCHRYCTLRRQLAKPFFPFRSNYPEYFAVVMANALTVITGCTSRVAAAKTPFWISAIQCLKSRTGKVTQRQKKKKKKKKKKTPALARLTHREIPETSQSPVHGSVRMKYVQFENHITWSIIWSWTGIYKSLTLLRYKISITETEPR